MRLEHSFEVPAPIDEVWQALLDPERVAPCMPGATLTGVEGSTFTGTVKVKLGAMSLQYGGSGEFVETDPAAHRLVIKAAGKDARGAGTASATSEVTLSGHDGATTGTVVSDVKVTGRPAQFGRGLISEVAGRILAQFASNLSARLTPAPGERHFVDEVPADGRQRVEEVRENEAVDLMQVAGTPVLKRLAGAVLVVAALAAIGWLIGRMASRD